MYKDDEFGELDNDDLNQQQDEFDYDEDLMDDGEQQPQIQQNQNQNTKIQNQPQRRQSTPYQQPMEEEVLDEENKEEEGEVYEYEDESEIIKDQSNQEEEVEQDINDEEYEENYEEQDFDQDQDQEQEEEEIVYDEEDDIQINQNKTAKQEKNQQNKYKQPSYNEQKQNDDDYIPKPIQNKPPIKKKPLIKQEIKPKLTFIQKYSELLKEVDYQQWKPKQLYEENKLLRQKLKEISDEVNKLVEQNAQKIPLVQVQQPELKRQKTNQSSIPGVTVTYQEIQNNKTKIEQQRNEIYKLEQRIEQVKATNYLIILEENIKKIENERQQLEQKKKQEFLKQKQRGKDLDKYENQEGIDKLVKEKNNIQIEIEQTKRKNIELNETIQKQYETIQKIKDDLPQIDQTIIELLDEAEEQKVDVGNGKFSKLKDRYILLMAQKDNIIRHQQIMEKKDKQLEMIEKEIKELKKEKERIDQLINQDEMSLIEIRKSKEDLKTKVPAEIFKQIPATMTQESISSALQNEKKSQEQQRKLQSAKPPINKNNHEIVQLKIPIIEQKKQEKQILDNFISNQVEEDIIQDETETQNKIILQPESIKQEQQLQKKIENTQIEPQQIKMNSRPFNLLKKSDDQQPVQQNVQPNLGQSNISNQQSNNSEIQSEYTGPSRMMRMKRPQKTDDQPQFIIHDAKPVEIPKEIIKQHETEQPKQQFTIQQEKQDVQEYQPVFQNIRKSNRPRGLDFNYDSNQNDSQSQATSQPTIDYQTQQETVIPRRRNRGVEESDTLNQPIKEELKKQENTTQSISNQQQHQQQPKQDEDLGQRKRLNLFQENKNIEPQKNEEPSYEFQPRQEKQIGRRNRGNNKLNIWEEEPQQQKENIEIEVKEIKQVEIPQKNEEKELTLEEILGGASKQEEYRPNQNRKTNERPNQEIKTNEPTYDFNHGNRAKRNNQIDKQKELALKAEGGGLLDDFEF